MDHRVENALRGKVDEWRFNALESKVSHLESENRNLKEELGRVDSRVRNQYSVLEQLLQFLIDQPGDMQTLENLQALRRCLY